MGYIILRVDDRVQKIAKLHDLNGGTIDEF